MGIEIQGQGGTNETSNLLVQGNHFTNWVNPVADGNTIAYSIVTTGTRTRVVGNYAQGNLPTGCGVELSGPGAAAVHNYIDGFSCSLIGYMSRDDMSYNNVINSNDGICGAAICTFGRTDEIVVGNTSNPNMPIPFGGVEQLLHSSNFEPKEARAQTARSVPIQQRSATAVQTTLGRRGTVSIKVRGQTRLPGGVGSQIDARIRASRF